MEELTVKGIILSAAPQGEYGRRLTILTDLLGKVTAFAGGAAKQKSHIIGAIRPMTAASFDLAKGRGAWNLHSVRVIDAFEELPMDIDASFYASYVLELGAYFSEAGMPEDEARSLLNLMFVTLSALRKKDISPELIRRFLELRLLKLQGEYTMKASDKDTQAAALANTLWQHVLNASLSGLYDMEKIKSATGIPGDDREIPMDAASVFSESVDRLFKRQFAHSFRSLKILEQM